MSQLDDLAGGGDPERRAPAGPPHKRRKHSVLIAGHRTSLSIEEAFWDQLKAIAARRRISMNKLIGEIDTARGGARPTNLSSAIRVFVLEHLTGVR